MADAADMGVWDAFDEEQLSPDHDALYREHYPKFAQRRPVNNTSKDIGPSPNRSPYTTNSYELQAGSTASSASTKSSVMLLTPPSMLRRATLPTPRLAGYDDLTEEIILPPPPCQTSFAASKRYTSSHSPESSLATHETTSKSRKNNFPSRLIHLPERSTAPKRPLDITRAELPSSWLPLSIAAIEPVERVAPLKPNNSLGLEIEHIEEALAPFTTSPSYEVDENVSPQQIIGLKASVANGGANPISPPPGRAIRSPLTSIHGSSLMVGEEGARSVEASRYELGKAEAAYIARKLAEEQRKRQASEKAASSEDFLETRGRSRAKKRAVSYSSGSVLG